MRPLNILIGPNASGKSNFIDCIGLLQALPGNVSQYINDRGGADSWTWREAKRSGPSQIVCHFTINDELLAYECSFGSKRGTLAIQDESLEESGYAYMKRAGGDLQIHSKGLRLVADELVAIDLPPTESALAAYRNPLGPVGIRHTQRAFSDVRVYRGFDTGLRADARIGVSSSGPKLPLEPNGSNLALVLQEMDFHGSMKTVKEYLSRLSNRFEDIKVRAEGGRSQLYLQERGLGMVSATRLSDGTLQFLCLMAILFDPNPAPLVCIEEPEIGLHPEALALVGDALREASKRMQLVVTTHSDALVDRFTDEPENVVVCERDFDESTCFRRLSSDQLKAWLEEYSLGELWRRGEIGGTQR